MRTGQAPACPRLPPQQPLMLCEWPSSHRVATLIEVVGIRDWVDAQLLAAAEKLRAMHLRLTASHQDAILQIGEMGGMDAALGQTLHQRKAAFHERQIGRILGDQPCRLRRFGAHERNRQPPPAVEDVHQTALVLAIHAAQAARSCAACRRIA